ncbi:MAG TPA: hypothetical protein VE052_07555, partial [Gemmatimonadaceae bacterium]|nr:hypothetical protein [Gemmatimonadaceae bacterium]
MAPELQDVLQRLRGEVGSDDEVRRRFFIGVVNAVQKAESDPGELQVRLPDGSKTRTLPRMPFASPASSDSS